MVTPAQLLTGVLLPLCIAAAVLALGLRLTRQSLGRRESKSRFDPLAIVAAFVIGWLAVPGFTIWPKDDFINLLLFLAPFLALLAMADAWWPGMPLQGRVGLAIAGVPISFWLLARSQISTEEQPTDFKGWMLAIVIAVGIAWVVALGEMGRRVSARRLYGFLLLAMVPAGMAVAVADSFKTGQVVGLLIAALLGMLIVNFCWSGAGTARGLVLTGSLFGGWLLCEYLFSYSQRRLLIGVMCFPAPMLAASVQYLEGRLGPTRTTILQCLLVQAIAGLPLALVILDFIRDDPGSAGY